MPKRIMRSFKLNEVSAVTNPAQEGARVTIMKRDFSADERRAAASSGAAMPDGSFPIKNGGDLKNAIRLVGHAKDPAAAKRHIISRARSLGLTSSLPDDWTSGKINKDIDDMTSDEVKKMIDEAVVSATKLAATEAALAATKLAATEAELAKLGKAKKPTLPMADDGDEPDADDEAKKAWRSYTAKQVAKAVEATKAGALEDEVIKVGEVEFRKSTTQPEVFNVIKAQQAEIAKEREARELADFAKRAETELGALPGKSNELGAAMRAMTKMDEATRKTLETALKAGNAAMKAGFDEIGKNRGIIEGSATDRLEKLAEEHATKNNTTVAVGYDEVLKTREGRELYAETRKERPAARGMN